MEPGRVKLTATRLEPGATINATGTTVYDAAGKLISMLTEKK